MFARLSPFLFGATLTLGSLGCTGSAFEQGPSDALRGYSRALQEKRVEDAYRYLSDDAKRSLSLEAFRRSVEENPTETGEVAESLQRPTTDPVVTAVVTVPSGEELHMVYEDGKWRVDAAAVDLYSQATPRQALVGFIRAFERKRYDVLLRYVSDADREGLAPSATHSVGSAAPNPAAPTPATTPTASAATPPATTPPGTTPGTTPPAATPANPPGLSGNDSGELTVELMRDAWEGPVHERILRTMQALKAALPTATIEETGEFAAMAYGSGSSVSFIRERGAWKIKDF